MKKLMILGAGGHGKVCADTAARMGAWEDILFLDDRRQSGALGFPLAGGLKNIETFAPTQFDAFVAIGDAAVRLGILHELEAKGFELPVLIHPSAVVGAQVLLGPGTVLMPNTAVNADSSLGYGCIINTGATVDHDCTLEEGVHVSVGAHVAGTVHIGAKTWVGIGACISNNISICADCMIGAGAVVIRDIGEPGTYMGVPAVRKR